MYGSLTGRVAPVTGSSRGIGAEIARHFARHGAAVVVHGRDRAAAETVAREITTAGGRALAATAELTGSGELEDLRGVIEQKFGMVDLLVANAGGSHTAPGPFESISEAGWHASIEANLTTTFLTIRTFLPSMKAAARGNSITISSSAGRRSSDRSPIPYAAAKAGVQLMTGVVLDVAGGTVTG